MASVIFSELYLSDVRHEFIKDRRIKADCLEEKKDKRERNDEARRAK